MTLTERFDQRFVNPAELGGKKVGAGRSVAECIGLPLEASMSSLCFAEVARKFGQVARRRGLRVCSFRSPPRTSGLDRSLRRFGDGHVIISVAIRGRIVASVVADMIDGVVAANEVFGAGASYLRQQLWQEIGVTQESIHDAA